MMEFMIENWKWIAAIGAFLGVIVMIAIGVSSAFPGAATIKEWSIQESIFYGCALIAFAIFITA